MIKYLCFLLGLLLFYTSPNYAANFGTTPAPHTAPSAKRSPNTTHKPSQRHTKRLFSKKHKLHQQAQIHTSSKDGMERFLRYAIIIFLLALPLAFIIVGFVLPLVWMWITGFALLFLYILFFFLFLTVKMGSRPSIDV